MVGINTEIETRWRTCHQECQANLWSEKTGEKVGRKKGNGNLQPKWNNPEVDSGIEKYQKHIKNKRNWNKDVKGSIFWWIKCTLN